jgi:prepilin peptidase CpaA
VKNANVETLLAALIAAASDPRTAGLVTLLAMAVVIDCRTLRLPNWLTLGGTLYALAVNTLPLSATRTGIGSALAGLAFGLAVFLPAYALRATGAGDVKLMAAIGAFLGVPGVFGALLFSFIAGGVAAIAFGLWRRTFRRMTANVAFIAQGLLLAALSGTRARAELPQGQSTGKLPYALAICTGTLAWLFLPLVH